MSAEPRGKKYLLKLIFQVFQVFYPATPAEIKERKVSLVQDAKKIEEVKINCVKS